MTPMKYVRAKCNGTFTLPLWSACHGVVALTAMLLVFWLDRRVIWLPPASAVMGSGRAALVVSWCAGCVVGVVAGYVVSEAMQWWLCGTRAGRAYFHAFHRPPTGVSAGGMAVYASIVGACEEVVFRGALQPYVGLGVATTLFAVLHVRGGGVEWWSRIATAALVGGLAGLLYEYTANLMAPILCHVVVNYRNMRLLAKWTSVAPAASDARRSSASLPRWPHAQYVRSAASMRIGGRVVSS